MFEYANTVCGFLLCCGRQFFVLLLNTTFHDVLSQFRIHSPVPNIQIPIRNRQNSPAPGPEPVFYKTLSFNTELRCVVFWSFADCDYLFPEIWFFKPPVSITGIGPPVPKVRIRIQIRIYQYLRVQSRLSFRHYIRPTHKAILHRLGPAEALNQLRNIQQIYSHHSKGSIYFCFRLSHVHDTRFLWCLLEGFCHEIFDHCFFS
jgi:hypothetical protein